MTERKTMVQESRRPAPCSASSEPAARATLPAWTYGSEAFFAAEREAVFMATWQLVCHVADLPQTGDFVRFRLLGEEAVVVRGEDGVVRAFHNVCRHRASRLVIDGAGNCGRTLRCPYHGWTYDLAGQLRLVPGEDGFEGLDKSRIALKALEVEIFLGLVFIRFGGREPAVARLLAPHRTALEHYRIEEMQPRGGESRRELAVNWKVAVDNNIEAYHVPVGHPGLQRLFGPNYTLETNPHGTSRGGGRLTEGTESPAWSERMYRRLLPRPEHLPPERAWGWYCYAMFPSLALDVYPDQIDFFQILPLSVDRTLLRSRAYALPDDRRELRAARYLNDRINRLVGREDIHLVEGVQSGLGSRAYGRGLLSRDEARVFQFHEELRARIPAATSEREPAGGCGPLR